MGLQQIRPPADVRQQRERSKHAAAFRLDALEYCQVLVSKTTASVQLSQVFLPQEERLVDRSIFANADRDLPNVR